MWRIVAWSQWVFFFLLQTKAFDLFSPFASNSDLLWYKMCSFGDEIIQRMGLLGIVTWRSHREYLFLPQRLTHLKISQWPVTFLWVGCLWPSRIHRPPLREFSFLWAQSCWGCQPGDRCDPPQVTRCQVRPVGISLGTWIVTGMTMMGKIFEAQLILPKPVKPFLLLRTSGVLWILFLSVLSRLS